MKLIPLPPEMALPEGGSHLEVHSADGTRLNLRVYEADGDADAATVVLAHGWTLAAVYWARVVHALHGRVRLVLYDQRGHDHSGPAGPDGFSPTALAADLAVVLTTTVPAGRPCVVAGHSMGGMALVALAGRHPDVLRERVAAALLASTAVERLLPQSRALPLPPALSSRLTALTARGLGDPRALQALPGPMARAMIREVTLSRCATKAEAAFTAAVIRACPPQTHAGFGAMLATLDLTDDVPALDVPALVLVGTDDRLTPPWHARRIDAALPRSLGLVELDGIGHMTPVQTPGILADAVLELVRDHTGEHGPATSPVRGTEGAPGGAP